MLLQIRAFTVWQLSTCSKQLFAWAKNKYILIKYYSYYLPHVLVWLLLLCQETQNTFSFFLENMKRLEHKQILCNIMGGQVLIKLKYAENS